MKFVGLLLVLIHLTYGNQHCPSLTPEINYNDVNQIQAHAIATVARLWNTQSPELSVLGKRLESMMLEMVVSRNELWVQYSVVVSFWISAYYPYFNATCPSLCPFKNVIEATLEYSKKHDCGVLRGPMKNFAVVAADAALLVAATALNNSQCEKYKLKSRDRQILGDPHGSWNLELSDVFSSSCRDDGRIYDISGYLGLFYKDFRVEIGCIDLPMVLKQLYHSTSASDNYLAIIALTCMPPFVRSWASIVDNDIKFGTFHLKQTPVLPHDCCKDFLKALREAVKNVRKEGIRAAKKALEEIGCQ